MNVCAIVPVRALGEGKTRLSAVLSPHQRASLVRSMLEHVVGVLRTARGVERIVLVTSDDDLNLPGVERIRDEGRGLNAAVELALTHITHRFDAAIVVAGDVPYVTAAEIERLIEVGRDHDVVVVPDRHKEGTNALWLRLPARIQPHFGVASLEAHLETARACGASVTVEHLPGLSHDVDVPDDLPDEPLSTEIHVPHGCDCTQAAVPRIRV
ncbi:hypothetical protein ACG33_10260 [Steroidobacter denitrificans]|uniref:3-phospho-D-glycerate guanylyltransferase n=1 Tax=Steroidobacter denitrificans TaxID=465721 RepID=A0A127FAM8_STEDE|nr:2-phospho-L-lactate guanylyltransferase [Steroidobacter denitrificans]AMN47476.1 hypothetical protein ACG33_10260 [Steroidobacter denitrificans]